MEKGLLALNEGDWETAERALEKSASSHGRTTARYLAAAEAADGQAAGERAERYLEQADTRNRKQRFLVELTRARILVSNGEYEKARPLLEELQRKRRKHPQVLDLLSRCYTELGEWEPLVKLLPVMIKADMLDTAKAAELKRQAAIVELQHSKDRDSLQSDWRSLPKNLQRDPEVVLAFADRAIHLEAPELTEDVIRVALKQEWQPSLLIPYGKAGDNDASKRLRQCEKWLQVHPEDPWLHLTLGRLCAREELWGTLEDRSFSAIEIDGRRHDPFDANAVNEALGKHGLLYSAGYGNKAKSHFFLARLEKTIEQQGYRIYISAEEYARDLSAPPAMSLGKEIFIRRESLRRMLWEKLEEWR